MKAVCHLLSIMALVGLSVAAVAGPKAAPIDVTAYADQVRDGDWTAAIRAAVAEAAKTRAYRIYFPAGHYNVSDTIDMNAATPLTDGATIQQHNPEKDIFYADGVWQRTIEGFTFYGGRDQIAIGNKNVDQGFLVIRDCRFKNASGAAIRFLRHEPKDTASTYCLVESCHFADCIQALISVSDQATFRDAWITTSTRNTANLAVIENYGNLKCENILGVPHVSGTDQRWIDNHGLLICRYFRFGGEGAGFTPVVNYAGVSKRLYGSFVVIENSFVAALGNNKRACAVYCEEIPNMITIRDCNLAGVPAVKVRPSLDLATYFDGVRPGMVRYEVEHNIGEFAGSLPEAMIAAAAKRDVAAFSYGDKQLSAAATAARIDEIRALAANYPDATEPGTMTWQVPKGKTGRVQQLEGYVDITPATNTWSVADNLDGVTEVNSDYLAVAPVGTDVAIVNRIEQGSYPHIRIEGVQVDLDRTPFLTWKFKDVGEPGGHVAVKVIDTATEAQATLMEDYYTNQAGYFAYDLRRALGKTGTITVDIKLYLCGSRIVAASGENMAVYLNKGDFMLLDFMRLEPAGK